MVGVTAMTYLMYASSGVVVTLGISELNDEYNPWSEKQVLSHKIRTLKEEVKGLREDNIALRVVKNKNGHLVYIKGDIKDVNHAQMKDIWGDKYMVGK